MMRFIIRKCAAEHDGYNACQAEKLYQIRRKYGEMAVKG